MAKKDQAPSFNDLIKGLENSNLKMSSAIEEQIKAHLESQKIAERTETIAEASAKDTADIKQKEDAMLKVLKAGLIDKSGDGLNSNVIKLIKEIAVLRTSFTNPKKQAKKEDLTEQDVSNAQVQKQQLELLTKIEKNTSAGGAGGKGGKPPEGGGGGLFSGIGDNIKKLGSSMSGKAKDMLAYAGALFIAAKGLQEFAKVEWSSIAKGAVAITGLALATKLAGDGNAYKSILALGAGVLALGFGLQQFSEVSWGEVLKGSVAILIFAKAVQVAGNGDAYKSILALGAGVIMLGAGLQLFSEVSFGDIIYGTVAMFALAKASKAAGSGDSYKNILALGAGVTLLAYGLKQFATVSFGDIIYGTVALFALSKATSAIGESKGGITTMLALGAALWITSKAFQNFAELDWGGIMKGIVGLGALAIAAIAIGKMAGQVTIGAAALLALGAATWIVSKAFQNFAEISFGDILKGIAAIGALTLAIMALGTVMMTGVGALMLGAGVVALIALSAAVGAFGVAAMLAGAGMMVFTEGIERLAAISGEELLKVASGIIAVGAALAVFGAASMVSALENLVTNFLSIGQDSPVEQLEKIGKAGPGIEAAATGMEKLAAAMKVFGDIDNDNLEGIVDTLDDFPWLRAAIFAKAGGNMSTDGKTVSVGAAGSAPAGSAPAGSAPAGAKPAAAGKAPMTTTSTQISQKGEATQSGVTDEQIKSHPNYKKYYDREIKAGEEPEDAEDTAATLVQWDIEENPKGSKAPASKAPAKGDKKRYDLESDIADLYRKKDPAKDSAPAAAPASKAPMTNDTPSLKGPKTNEPTKEQWLKVYNKNMEKSGNHNIAQAEADQATGIYGSGRSPETLKGGSSYEDYNNYIKPGSAASKANEVSKASSDLEMAKQKQPASSNTVVSAPTNITKQTKNVMVKQPTRNPEGSITSYFKSKFA
jgi:hypothetical protein